MEIVDQRLIGQGVVQGIEDVGVRRTAEDVGHNVRRAGDVPDVGCELRDVR